MCQWTSYNVQPDLLDAGAELPPSSTSADNRKGPDYLKKILQVFSSFSGGVPAQDQPSLGIEVIQGAQ